MSNLATAAEALKNATFNKAMEDAKIDINASIQQGIMPQGNYQSGPYQPQIQQHGYPQSPSKPATLYDQVRENMTDLQKQIKLKRVGLGWTQRQLAQACDMSQGTITRAEKHGWISLNCLIKISIALGEQLMINKK